MTENSIEDLTRENLTGKETQIQEHTEPEKIEEFTVEETGDDPRGGFRLDMAIAARLPTISRSAAQKAVKAGDVHVDGITRAAGFRLQPGMVVSIKIPAQKTGRPGPESGGTPLDILYEDEYLLVINKPAGLVVHPGAGHRSGTLVNRLLASGRTFSTFGGEDRPGIVHRLDKDTSGVLIVALDNTTHEKLSSMFRERLIHKTYLALVLGPATENRGVIDTLFARRAGDRRQFTGKVAEGKTAVTEFETLARASLSALVAAHPKTGRTHQIRVHMAESGHPIVGDRVYGRGWPRRGSRPESEVDALEMMKRHALHAFRIEFDHPRTGEKMNVMAPLPGDFRRSLEGLFGSQWQKIVENPVK